MNGIENIDDLIRHYEDRNVFIDGLLSNIRKDVIMPADSRSMILMGYITERDTNKGFIKKLKRLK